MKKISLNVFLGYLILVIVAGATSAIGIYIARNSESKQQQQAKPVELLPSQHPDYDAIKGKDKDPKIKKVEITKDCPKDGCISKIPANIKFDEIVKTYKVVGKFSRAYLYIEALVDYKRPLTSWDDIYFKINGNGGHLIPDGNVLATPPGESTTYLYDLRKISYFPTIKNKEKKIDKQEDMNIFEILESSSTINIVAAISSNRPGRVMKEVSIYYECYEGSDCSIDDVTKP